jgi:hypothetical protein
MATMSRRRRGESGKATNPSTTSMTARPHLGTWNDSTPARRERQRNEPIVDIDDGATHLGTSNDSPPARRERQGNEPIVDIDDGATHLGTWSDSPPARRERQRNELNDDIDDGATHLGMLNDNALRLLQIMGRRGSWTSDLLFERSALPFPELQHAILLLELEGRVRRRGCEIDPV